MSSKARRAECAKRAAMLEREAANATPKRKGALRRAIKRLKAIAGQR